MKLAATVRGGTRLQRLDHPDTGRDGMARWGIAPTLVPELCSRFTTRRDGYTTLRSISTHPSTYSLSSRAQQEETPPYSSDVHTVHQHHRSTLHPPDQLDSPRPSEVDPRLPAPVMSSAHAPAESEPESPASKSNSESKLESQSQSQSPKTYLIAKHDTAIIPVMTYGFLLSGQADPGRLRSALEELVGRWPLLGSTIVRREVSAERRRVRRVRRGRWYWPGLSCTGLG